MNKILIKIFASKFIVKDIPADVDPIAFNLYKESIDKLVKVKIFLTINISVTIILFIIMVLLIHRFLVN